MAQNNNQYVGRQATATVALNALDTDATFMLEPLYRAMVVERNLLALQNGCWPTEVESVDSVKQTGTVLMSAKAGRRESVVVQLTDALVLVDLSGGQVDVVVASQTSEAAQRALDVIRERLPQRVSEEGAIRVTFHSEREPVSRTIPVPSWDEIRGNYAQETKQRLQQLIATTDGRAGQLLVWHGQPGTGKTYALRALGWEWRSWCDLHYITDPEAFFGDTAYMFRTFTSQVYGSDDKRWRLFIAEDTGELLSKDAKERTGQGLSRLLNIVDGLLGQGLRVIVLITTNDPLSGMHPAVTRPGRCSAPLEFQPFSIEEANAWLQRHGRPALSGRKSRTLAELYIGGTTGLEPTIGFAA
jgi:hypothetical protein